MQATRSLAIQRAPAAQQAFQFPKEGPGSQLGASRTRHHHDMRPCGHPRAPPPEEVPDAAVQSRGTRKNYQAQLDLHATKQIVQPQSALDRLEANVRDMADRFPREWLGQYENVRYFEDQQAERNAGKDPSKMTRTERFLYNWWEGGRWKIVYEGFA